MEYLHNVDWHVTDRCNLRCSSCGHFCPLADYNDKTIDRTPEQAEADFSILYEKTNKGEYVENLCLTGGEPTLNKYLPKIIDIAEKYFKDKVSIWSNVVNLYFFDDELIQKIKEYDIVVNCTLYDFNNEGKVRQFFESNSIKYNMFFKNFSGNWENGCEFFNKFFTYNKISDLENISCNSKFWCGQLRDQKLYVCQYLGYMDYFISKFGIEEAKKIGYCKSNKWLDLNEVNTYSQIESYIKEYDDEICYHCIDRWANSKNADISRRIKKWQPSKQELSEWVIDDINNLFSEI